MMNEPTFDERMALIRENMTVRDREVADAYMALLKVSRQTKRVIAVLEKMNEIRRGKDDR